MTLHSVYSAIKTLRIQGATAVAEAALQAWSEAKNKDAAAKLLASARPTEPMLRNLLALAQQGTDPKVILKELAQDRKKIVEIGARKIRNNSLIFTHCHSSTVCNILKLASKQGRCIWVHCTETRPLFQGRLTAQELAKARIPVTLFVDSAARLAMKKADMFLIGADAITSEGKVVNKIGSEMLAEMAAARKIPVYVCTHSLKYDSRTEFGFAEEIENRHAEEVWKNAPSGVRVSNLAFEMINPDLITGIISELGVLAPEAFVVEVQKKLKERI